jgi:DNA polymerase-4
VTETALQALRIRTTGQLAEVPQETLEEHFGRWGTALHRKARGEDGYEFLVDAEPKSISQNHTFGEDTSDRNALDATLSHLTQKACKRLREAGLETRTLTLTIRYAGFETHTRSKTLAQPANLDGPIHAVFRELFRAHCNAERHVRLLGVSLGGLMHGPQQLDLLDGQQREKLERLARTTDRLRDRFGFSKIQFGGSLRRDET